MGQYLAIGLATKIWMKKIEINKAKLTIEALQEKMQQQFNHIPEI